MDLKYHKDEHGEVFKVENHSDPFIKVGDVVRIRDGSGLRAESTARKYISIVTAYPEITGSDEPLKYLDGVVLALNTGVVSEPDCYFKTVYHLDAKISINGAVFYTCSAFLEKQATSIPDKPEIKPPSGIKFKTITKMKLTGT